jgi:hypothetical protein
LRQLGEYPKFLWRLFLDANGIQESVTSTTSEVLIRDLLMAAWRNAVIKLLRAALHVGLLRTEMALDQMQSLLDQQENRW